jgi:tocopherol O-methyltransferase
MIVPRTAPAAPDIGGHYDELDGLYREVWGEHVHHGLFTRRRQPPAEAAWALARRVVEAAGVGAGDRACDVGCGYGATARLAAGAGVHVVGLTLSVAQAAVAARQPGPPGVPQPEVVVRDWLANGLPDARFDAAWAVESTTHMADRQRAFDEVARVLRPGGRLVLCVWMASPSPTPRQVRWLLEPICREGRLAGLGTAAENRAWMETAGLRVEQEEDWSRAVAPTWGHVARRVVWGLATDATYRRYLRDGRNQDRAFALTVGRIWAAYRVGALRYGFFVARKPGA